MNSIHHSPFFLSYHAYYQSDVRWRIPFLFAIDPPFSGVFTILYPSLLHLILGLSQGDLPAMSLSVRVHPASNPSVSSVVTLCFISYNDLFLVVQHSVARCETGCCSTRNRVFHTEKQSVSKDETDCFSSMKQFVSSWVKLSI